MIDAPADWGAVVFRAATTAVVAFIVLQAKEFFDAGRFDTPGTGADALMIGIGMLVLASILKLAKGEA
jgi:hypothetical protein